MIDKRFTFRENLFLAVVLMLLAAFFSFMFLGKPLFEKIEAAQREQAAVEDELEIQCYMAERKEYMEKRMEQEPDRRRGELGSYDNLTYEITELGLILTDTRTYDLEVFEEERSGDLVRRDILISYRVDSYEQVQKILEDIEHGTYCCVVKDVDIVREDVRGGKENEASEEDGGGSVYGTILVTYYEIMDEEDEFMDALMEEMDWEGWYDKNETYDVLGGED